MRNAWSPFAGRGAPLWLGCLVLLIVLVYGLTLLAAGEGRPVAPLDDAYIHFQYARQIGRGHPWQYNDGDPPSTGATSPLYPFLLSAGYRLGFSGERLVWFALGVGVVSLSLSSWLVYRIIGRLVAPFFHRAPALTRWAPVGAATIFLLTGAVQWTYLSGMESGLFTVLVLAALDTFIAQDSEIQDCSPRSEAERGSEPVTRHPPLTLPPSFWIALAALTRPEGLIMAGVLWLVVVGRSWNSDDRSGRWGAVGPVSLALLVGVLPLLLNLALTGSPVATGAQAKSWLGNVPFRLTDILHSIFGNYRRILEQFALGLLAPRPWFLAPGILLLALVGWMASLRRRRWGIATLIGGWFVLGTLATAALITATWHVGRYQVPFLAVLTPMAALGLVTLTGELARRWQELAAAGLALGLIAAALVSTFQAQSLYRRTVRTVTGQHLALADWIRHHLPPDARVGVHDTGAIRYVGARATYDMIGLTTQGAATAWRHGAGAVFERMEGSPARPDYFATYPDVFSLPYLAATDLFGVELFRADVPDFAVASAGPVQAVYQADWRLADSGDRLYQADTLRRVRGLTLVDHVDLADLEDEAAHNLTFWEGVVRPGFPTEVQQFHYRTDPMAEVLDGGRLVTGGLVFRIAAQPGRPLLLVARLHAAQAGAVRVVVDGHDTGLWRYPALPGEWLETAFVVSDDAVTQKEVEVRFQVETGDPAFRHFALYYLWAWQGEMVSFVPEPEQPLSARLGDAVELVGFDLPSQSYRPGGTVQLVLYWRAVTQPTDDAKVFVHLYDESGEIVAQQDHRPYCGTRPPCTWSSGEALDDPYTLALPPDLSPGRYTLAVGMYDATTGDRLAVTVAAEHVLSDNRILLSTLDVASETEQR